MSKKTKAPNSARFQAIMQCASPRMAIVGVYPRDVTDALDLNDREARLFIFGLEDQLRQAMIDAADELIYEAAKQANIRQKAYQDIAS